MGDLTANLSRHEFACKGNLPGCVKCSRAPVDYMLVTTIQQLADAYTKEYQDKWFGSDWARTIIDIKSGHRCIEYDAKIKGLNPDDFNGKKVSEHVWYMASDFAIEIILEDGERILIDPEEMATRLDELFPDSCGIGIYDNRVHFDTRPTRARWDNRGK